MTNYLFDKRPNKGKLVKISIRCEATFKFYLKNDFIESASYLASKEFPRTK